VPPFGLRPDEGEPRLSYDRYLGVGELLRLQRLQSDPPQHDEMLFIVIHQVYELWFRLLLHELDAVIRCLDRDDVLGAHRLVRRCIEIERLLVEQVNVLETMTPNDFLTFRDRLMPASGFQSVQFRALEFLCGLKEPGQLDLHANDPAARMDLERRLGQPSLGDRFLDLLARRGFDANPAGDLLRIYQQPEANYDLYLLCEAFIEFDEMFYLWRLRHVAMVERMIGSKPGTGGSEGVAYLRTTLGRKFFPPLWELRSYLSARGR
jgi:tryptophan 2,3-dioxygenase